MPGRSTTPKSATAYIHRHVNNALPRCVVLLMFDCLCTERVQCTHLRTTQLREMSIYKCSILSTYWQQFIRSLWLENTHTHTHSSHVSVEQQKKRMVCCLLITLRCVDVRWIFHSHDMRTIATLCAIVCEHLQATAATSHFCQLEKMKTTMFNRNNCCVCRKWLNVTALVTR